MVGLGDMICPCFRSKTLATDAYIDPVYRAKVYSKDVSPSQSVVSTGEPGSVYSSLRGSYSSQDFQNKPSGAETFTMAELARATGNFSAQNKIGQGGFGMVYKGRLRDGRMVAIKRGKKDAYEQRLSVEFRTEVEMLSQVCTNPICIKSSLSREWIAPEPALDFVEERVKKGELN